MGDNTVGTAPATTKLNTSDIEKANDANFQQQLQLQQIQAKVTSQNTLTTALSAIQKGNDDVLRAMANNLK